jgi:malonyl-CoA/methylmalonyl-CoA synthetase
VSVVNANLYAVVEAGFPADRNRPLLLLADGSIVSWAALDAQVARFARLLRNLGVVPGDRVAVQVEKSVANMALYLACIRAGGVFLPLNTAYQKGELAYFLGDAEPRLVICSPSSRALVEPLALAAGVAHVLDLDAAGQGTLSDQAAGLPDRFETVHRERSDLAAILYTSGTTGRSKGAMISHGNLTSNALTLRNLWGFTDADVLLHALPIFHVHGLFVALNTALLSGSRILFLPKFDADQVISLLPQATAMMGVPTFYTRLLEHPGLTREAVSNLRLFISGSAPLLPDTFATWEQRTGHTILERYGMTETGMNTSNPLNGPRIAGAVGPALPGVEVRITGEGGAVLPAGEVGMIEVRGPNVFGGYWRMPEKTREEFRPDGFFITGDIGRIDEQGYVHIVGRAKDLIISGGYNIYPKEIELLIDGLDGVAESAVIGVPHPDFGESVVAVVRRQSGDMIGADTIIAICRRELANFKVPKRVIFVDELPRNTMGKVQKNLLRQEYQNSFAR